KGDRGFAEHAGPRCADPKYADTLFFAQQRQVERRLVAQRFLDAALELGKLDLRPVGQLQRPFVHDNTRWKVGAGVDRRTPRIDDPDEAFRPAPGNAPEMDAVGTLDEGRLAAEQADCGLHDG